MDWMQQLQPILQVLQWVVVLAAGVFMIFMRSIFAPRADHVALQLRVTALETANQLLQQQLGQSPTKTELHELQLAMTKLTGKIDVHNERMEGLEELQKVIKHQVEVMDGYLRERK
jgi:Co/Zn/Cd efflux system component